MSEFLFRQSIGVSDTVDKTKLVLGSTALMKQENISRQLKLTSYV